MYEMIPVSFECEEPYVMGRDLHRALEIRTNYRDWFPRMCEYGFVEGRDFRSNLSESTGGRPETNHQLSIDMAKEICMIQRTEIGKRCREYFLELEKMWNSPDAIMARALEFAKQKLAQVTAQYDRLVETSAEQARQIAVMEPKVSYYNTVLACSDLLPISEISKDYGWSARRMNEWLKLQQVQYRQGRRWLLYQKYAECEYTGSKTYVHPGKDGTPHTTALTCWTQKGRLFIYDLMKKSGYLPIMERDVSNSAVSGQTAVC